MRTSRGRSAKRLRATDGGNFHLVDGLIDTVDQIAAATGFCGVVRVDTDSAAVVAKAYGMAHRGYRVANHLDTQFGIASGTKGLTALTVVSLIEEGDLKLATTVRSVLGSDLPLVDERATVGHLLEHRSGIGDYLDEDAGIDVNDYLTPVAVHELATTEQYLRVLDGREAKFAPGERFSYCNSGYVVLALIAERVSSTSFYELVQQRICAPAGMHDTAFLRSDELPATAAVGYLNEATRSNVLHLPVRGSGDGGAYSTAADIHAMWQAFFAGQVVSPEWVAEMIRPHSDDPSKRRRYGLGFWLSEASDAVILEGYDAGVSFRTVHDPVRRLTYTVLSNTSNGAWPIARRLAELVET